MSLRHPFRAWMVSALLVPPLLTPLPAVQAGPLEAETPRLLAQASQGGSPQVPAQVLQWRQQIETLFQQRRYAEAIPLQLQELAWVERVLGPEHPSTASSLNNLGEIYRFQGRYREAEPLYKRSLGTITKVLGPDHPDTASSLNNLAGLYVSQGAYTKAESLYLRALASWEVAVGLKHQNTAISLNNLAEIYRIQSRYVEAESLYKRSLAIIETVLGKEHPAMATSLNNLALLYDSQSRYVEAETLSKRSLAIREKVLGLEHPDTANSLNNLAEIYRLQGRYVDAEPLFKRSLAINEKVFGREQPATATSLNNLGLLYLLQGRYGEAETLSKRSLAIQEKVLGLEHPDTAGSLNNLAVIYRLQGRYVDAEPLCKRSLAINEKVLGLEHPKTAISLNSLAQLYESQGRYVDAEPLYKRSLTISEKVLGLEHPDTAIILNNLASLYDSQGRYEQAEPLHRRGIAIQSRFLQEQLPLLPQSARQAQIQALDAAWEGAFTGADRSQSAAELALFSRLNRYGLLLDIEQRQALLSRAPGPTRQLAQEIAALTSQLADVRLSPPQRQALVARRDGLEQELYRQLPALKPQIVEPAQLAKALPVGAALLEFQRYRPFDGRQQPEQRWGPPRYLALVLTREGTPRAVDLGAAAPIDARIAKALATTEEKEEKREQGANPMALWQEVSAQIFPPALLQLLGGSKQWIVAPDGELSRIPYTALPSPQDPKRLLADAIALRLITSGRSLVPPATPSSSAPSTRPLVLANPDYGPAPAGTTPWWPLAASDREGRWIRNLINSTYYEQAEATTSKLTAAQGPRVLHVASHGYFAGASSQPAPRPPVPLSFADGLTRSAFAGLPAAREDAMLNSAIVLAGANRHLRPGSLPAGPASSAGSADADDGYLTAKEAAQLQLAGTELVVLSACDTLAGAQQSGEGLYGLQRALNAAGARSTLLSLWKVDDWATARFMQDYYGLLKQGKGRMEALLAVQEAFRTNPPQRGWNDPRYWAAWQLVGETGPIPGL